MPEKTNDDVPLDRSNVDNYSSVLEQLEERSKLMCTELEERIVVVTASLKTLKQSILKEKELWRNEVKETIELEKKLSQHNIQLMQAGDFNQQFEMLTNAFLKSQSQIQNQLSNAVYKQQLMEAENMCNLEMLKIRNSLECLAPLQAIASEWCSEIEEKTE